MKVLPVILSGGSGTRLWPLSRDSLPKQFLPLFSEISLFQETIRRVKSIEGFEILDPLIICNYEHCFLVKDQLKQINSPLKLTLDSNLQYLIREELIKAQSHFENIGSAAILMDVENGEILSLISLPDYDLNKRAEINDEIYTNKITLGVYELGSVFKTFTIAAGLENKIIKPSTVFKNLESYLKCDKYKISEHDKLPKNLTAEQILIRSSNIGAVDRKSVV